MSDFTKWPRLLVVGDNVTSEQANEILVRTDDWYLSTNDRAWERAVDELASAYGRPIPPPPRSAPEAYGAHHKANREWEEKFGVLSLHYMDNERIACAWIGGPKGWCDWDGTIGCANYNIGKWPDEESCTADWVAIAEAFPYLNLHAQLISDEGEGEIVATWAVKDGKAALVEPIARIAEPREIDLLGFLSRSERGVSLDRLREALEQVSAARSEQVTDV